MRRRVASNRHYTDVIVSLLDATEPVSFYDAVVLLRQMRGHDPDDKVVRALIGLHDAEHTTDGARDVLGDYLSALANRHENQRQLASRAITLKDHGKTARVTAGGRVELRLDERRAMGFRWEVASGGGHVARSRKSNEFPSTAIFDVACSRTGTMHLELEEKPPATGAPDERQKPRDFEITVVVEPREARD